MLCTLCAKHQATQYFKGIVNNQPLKLRLCNACAKKRGLAAPLGEAIFSLGDLVSALAAALSRGRLSAAAACQACGTTYAEFQRTSQLGCARCYKVFAPLIGPLLQRIQGGAQHIGKVAQSGLDRSSFLKNLAQKKLELQQAVAREAYEQAAHLRDQIRDIESRLTERPAARQKRSSA